MPSKNEDPTPNLDHALVEVARRMLMPHPEQGWQLDETGVRIIEEAILLKRDDPDLLGALLGLYEVAGQLHLDHGATEAAGSLLAIIGRCASKLELAGAVMDRLDRTEFAQRSKAQKLVGGAGRAAPSHAPAPKDAIPTHQLTQVLTANLGLRPSKPRKPKKSKS